MLHHPRPVPTSNAISVQKQILASIVLHAVKDFTLRVAVANHNAPMDSLTTNKCANLAPHNAHRAMDSLPVTV